MERMRMGLVSNQQAPRRAIPTNKCMVGYTRHLTEMGNQRLCGHPPRPIGKILIVLQLLIILHFHSTVISFVQTGYWKRVE